MCVGLTLVYAVSGVAVNHMRDWNPNYRVSRETLALSPVPPAATPTEITEHVVRELGLGETARGTFRVDSATVDIFFHDASVRVDLLRNEVTLERVQERRLLRAFNLLHLNEPRGLWTYAADLFAVALILLAVSGLFMMKGRTGQPRPPARDAVAAVGMK